MVDGYAEFDAQMQRIKNIVSDTDKENREICLRNEYNDLGLRVSELEDFLTLYKNGDIYTDLDCPIEILQTQLDSMRAYKLTLATRLSIMNGKENKWGYEKYGN